MDTVTEQLSKPEVSHVALCVSPVTNFSIGVKMQLGKYNFVKIGKEMKVLNKGNISCTLKCMNVKYIYIAVTWVELLLNQTIVASEKAIKK